MVNNSKLHLSRRLLGIGAAWLLASCANMSAVSGATAAAPTPAGGSAASGNLLRPWTVLTGARSGALPGGAALGSYILLRYPSAVSTRNNDIYLVDDGQKRIFRYDTARQTLTQFTTLTFEAGTSVYAAPDLSVYVITPASRQLLRFTRDGSPLPSLSPSGDLLRPVAVAMDEGGGRLLVADGSYNQIVVFNSLGRPLSVIKNPQQLGGIAAVAAGPDGIYVVDKISRQVVVLNWDGSFRYAFGEEDLNEPVAIAVSRDNIVFVGDKFDSTVKIYRVEQTSHGAVVSASGIAPGSFGGVSGLAVDGRKLYVTDGPNARVHILLIDPNAGQKLPVPSRPAH